MTGEDCRPPPPGIAFDLPLCLSVWGSNGRKSCGDGEWCWHSWNWKAKLGPHYEQNRVTRPFSPLQPCEYILHSKAQMLPGCEHTLWQGHMCFLIIVQGTLNSFLFFSWESVILSEKVINCTNIYFKGNWCKCFNTKRMPWKQQRYTNRDRLS